MPAQEYAVMIPYPYTQHPEQHSMPKTVLLPIKKQKMLYKMKKTCIMEIFAAVAQLDRVLGYEPRGRGFDSCQPRQDTVKGRLRTSFFFIKINDLRSFTVKSGNMRYHGSTPKKGAQEPIPMFDNKIQCHINRITP